MHENFTENPTRFEVIGNVGHEVAPAQHIAAETTQPVDGPSVSEYVTDPVFILSTASVATACLAAYIMGKINQHDRRSTGKQQ